MALDLNKLFTFVPATKTESFKTAHVGDSITSSDAFYNKICFLSGTGEIITHGKLFAINKLTDVSALKALVGNSLAGTGAGDLNVSTVIDFVQEVYEIAVDNRTKIGNENSGLTADLIAVTARVGMDDSTGVSARVKANENAIALLNKTDGSVGSVKKTVDDAIARVVASAPESFDTLKEIADWISSDTSGAAKMAADITELNTKVGTAASGNDAATGLYASVDNLQSQINEMKGDGGSIQDQITSNLNTLDGTVTLAGTTAAQPSTVNRDTEIEVLGSVKITEENGKLVQNSSSKVILKADAAGAAQKAYEDLLGTSTDANDGTVMTLHGVKNYASKLVSDKNVSARGDNSLISASATNNEVSVSATQGLIDAVGSANTAIQSVTLTSNKTEYLSINNESGAGNSTTASASFTPNIGTLTNNGIKVSKGTNGLASTDVVADIINGMEFWEEYTD